MKCCLQTSSACSSRPHLSAHGLPALSPVRSCCSRALQQHLGSLRQRQPCSRTTRAGIVCAAGGFSTQTAEATAAVEANTVPTATASAIAAAALRPLPFAALSRVLLTANNSTVFRTALNRRQPVSGPMGLLLFLMTLIAASLAAIRGVFVKKSKSCKTCRGFGLQRCRLCLGSGRVDWAAKLKHFDVCPLCMNKRFTICAECGGHYHRPMFRHLRRQVGGAFEPTPRTDNGSSGGFEGPIVLNLAMAGASAGTAAGGGNIVYRSMQSMDGGPGGQFPSNMTD